MLPEIGATELLVIAAVALIVVGPKDLPILMRRVGQFMAKMRAMAAEFRSSFDEMARQSELDELRREVEAMRNGKVMEEAAAGAGRVELDKVFGDIDEGLRSGAVALPQISPPPPVFEVDPAEEIEGAAPPPPTPRARKPKAAVAADAKPAPKPRAKKSAAANPALATKPATAKAKPASKSAKPRTKTTGADA